MQQTIYRITLISLLLTALVVSLGAYTRLTHAGLGCPDWPGCYGFLTVPNSSEEIAAAEQAFPHRPVEPEKAWNEMIHRYCAGLLGLMIAALFFLHLKARLNMVMPTILALTVVLQASLGMLTVTMNLMPLIVMGHLLGGFTTFCLLFIMLLQQIKRQKKTGTVQQSFVIPLSLHRWLRIGAVVVVLQIALGGWTAANYAAVSCSQLPICEGNWQANFSLSDALSIPSGYDNYEFGVHSHDARQSIHIMHRLGAVVVFVIVMSLVIALLGQPSRSVKKLAGGLALLLTLQIALGLANVVMLLPLMVAVAHNFVALSLLCYLLFLLLTLTPVVHKKSCPVAANATAQ